MKLTAKQKVLAKALNPKQLAFANLVAKKNSNKFTDAECYIKAGYKGKTKQSISGAAARMCANVRISAYLNSFKIEAAKSTGMNIQNYYQQLEDLVNLKVTDWYGKPINELPDHIACLVQEVKLTKYGPQLIFCSKDTRLKLIIDLRIEITILERKEAMDLGKGNRTSKMEKAMQLLIDDKISLDKYDAIIRGLKVQVDAEDKEETSANIRYISKTIHKLRHKATH